MVSKPLILGGDGGSTAGIYNLVRFQNELTDLISDMVGKMKKFTAEANLGDRLQVLDLQPEGMPAPDAYLVQAKKDLYLFSRLLMDYPFISIDSMRDEIYPRDMTPLRRLMNIVLTNDQTGIKGIFTFTPSFNSKDGFAHNYMATQYRSYPCTLPSGKEGTYFSIHSAAELLSLPKNIVHIIGRLKEEMGSSGTR